MIFSDAITLLDQLDGFTVASLFWHMILFEVPRYFLASAAVCFAFLSDRKPDLREIPDLSVSVLLPGHNEADNLRKSVMSIREQTVQPSQIVIVDDGSTDGMSKIAAQLRSEGLADVVLSTSRRGGKSAAANLGLGVCTGDIILIADADTTYDRDAFENLLREFADPRVGAVAGNLGVRNPYDSIVARLQAIQYLISISLGRRITDTLGILYIVSGAFGAFRRDALAGVGAWDVGPGEDADITMKLRRAGWKVRFAPDAWGLTDVPVSAGAFARQRLRWNRSVIRIRLRKFRSLLNPRRSQFSVLDALGILDILFFQVFLAASFVVYLVWLVLEYADFAPIILVLTSLVYVATGMTSFLFANLISGRHEKPELMPYAFLYGLFNSYFLRFVRLAAYLDELVFRRSYSDNYVPSTVRQQTEKF